jgi:DNA primase large subunit
MVTMEKKILLSKEDQVKYPFLRNVTNFVQNFNLDIRAITFEEYPKVVKFAVSWVEENIDRKPHQVNLEDPESELLAYPLALVFVYGLKKDWVINVFAAIEQKRIYSLLQKETNDFRISELARRGFGWNLKPYRTYTKGEQYDSPLKFSFSIDVKNFLEVAPQFHDLTWKLVNRYLDGGEVYLQRDEAIRLLSGAAKNKILEKAKEEEIKRFKLPDQFKPHLMKLVNAVDQRKDLYDENAPLVWVEEARPPCIMAIVNDLEAGKNLSHMARFTITTFMLNVGKSVEDILQLFNKVADFDEGKARYQIEHIAGQIGSKQKYKMPKCDVLRSFGLCVGPNELCNDIWHPISYYKIKMNELKNEKPKRDGGSKAA